MWCAPLEIHKMWASRTHSTQLPKYLHSDARQVRRLMINRSSAMIPQSQTLILTLILVLFSSAAATSSSSRSSATSPFPSPSPAKAIMSDPVGFLSHAPLLNDIFLLHPPPPAPSPCPYNRIDCLERRRSHRHPLVEPPPAKSEFEKLNFGKKIGLVFAAAAIILQVVFGGFLVYKRIQLRKLDRRGDRLVSASASS